MTGGLWVPSEAQLRRSLLGGQRRCGVYRIVEPDHVRATVMRDKLTQRATQADGLRCYICGHPIVLGDVWHLDHVRPLVVGGAHSLCNLEITHNCCNLMKGGKVLYDPPVGENIEPLLDRLRARNPADLWVEDATLARAVLVSPRPVPVDASIGRLPHVAKVVRVLRAQPDPYRAMGLSKLAEAIHITSRGQLDNSMWDKFMGFSFKGHGKGQVGVYHDLRLPPHPLLVATRVGRGRGRWGRRAFRLRFRVSLGEIDAFIETGHVGQFPDLPYPDHDEEPPTSLASAH